jgi:hypothetical protein
MLTCNRTVFVRYGKVVVRHGARAMTMTLSSRLVPMTRDEMARRTKEVHEEQIVRCEGCTRSQVKFLARIKPGCTSLFTFVV